MNENLARLEELMKDEAFLDALLSKKSPEEMHKLFAENGAALTMEEVAAFSAAIHEAVPEWGVELSADALDSVAGGRAIGPSLRALIESANRKKKLEKMKKGWGLGPGAALY